MTNKRLPMTANPVIEHTVGMIFRLMPASGDGMLSWDRK